MVFADEQTRPRKVASPEVLASLKLSSRPLGTRDVRPDGLHPEVLQREMALFGDSGGQQRCCFCAPHARTRGPTDRAAFEASLLSAAPCVSANSLPLLLLSALGKRVRFLARARAALAALAPHSRSLVAECAALSTCST